MSCVIKAVLSNPRRPECGQVAIPFPIPVEQYDQTIEMLQAISLDFSVNRDCKVDEIDSRYSVLGSIRGTLVNVDQLDLLAKRLDGFCAGEVSQFQAMAHKLELVDIEDFINLTYNGQKSRKEEWHLPEIFHIYASKGRDNYAELDLPATDYEMLDLMERLRLKPGELPYAEVLKIHKSYDYLDGCIREQPDIYQLNALAWKLSELTSVQEMAAFEGLVGMELRKSAAIELSRLIDFAHSTNCCVVAADAMTDFQLGKFLVDNEFVEEAQGLPDTALALLDYGRIGREHREQGGGVYTGFGYSEQSSEIVCASKTMDFRPRKPAYSILLNIAALPLTDGRLRKEDMLQLRLPAPEAQLREVLEKLGKQDWNDVAVSIVDCAVPSLNRKVYFYGETPLLLELSQRLSELDARGQMTKYKAILEANGCQELSQMISLAGAADACFFEPEISCPEDVARGELGVILCDKDAETVLPYIDLAGYGRALLARDHARLTGYGLVERRDGQPVLEEEQASVQGGMEMM